MSFLLSLTFSLQQHTEEEGRTGSSWKRIGAQTMYTHVSKCKTRKIKGDKKEQ
jgi:hypothetical protein